LPDIKVTIVPADQEGRFRVTIEDTGPGILKKQIIEQATTIRGKIQRKGKPTMAFPLRALSNVSYQPKRGFLQLKGKKKIRTLTVGTVKTFAQTLRMMSRAKILVEDD